MEADVLIIGSGAAGLTAALQLATSRKVVVLAKGSISDGATAWAQGGIAAVLEPGDNFANHIEDTMVAGAGLNNRATVEFVVENAPVAIERLAKLGVPFNLEGNDWHQRAKAGIANGGLSMSTMPLAGQCSKRLRPQLEHIQISSSCPTWLRLTSFPEGIRNAFQHQVGSTGFMR